MYVIHLWARPVDFGRPWLNIDEAAEVLASTCDGIVEHVYTPKDLLSERRGALYLKTTSAATAGKAVLAAVEQLIQHAQAASEARLRHPASFGVCHGVVVVSPRAQGTAQV
ncbi:hypothetical protein [Streptomyces werraensis]|uniref:hypothetical protein n=1 Tax=Streptomyces werraensis TaxID=68284 RepID=UPI0037F94E1A